MSLIFMQNEFETIQFNDVQTASDILEDVLFQPEKYNLNIHVFGGFLSDNMTFAGAACLYPNLATNSLNDFRIYLNSKYTCEFRKTLRRLNELFSDIPTYNNNLIPIFPNSTASIPVALIALFYTNIEETPNPIPTCVLYTQNMYQPLELLRQFKPLIQHTFARKEN